MRNLFRKEPPYITISAHTRSTSSKREAIGDGLWVRCENEHCRELLYAREYENNLNVCHKCEHHGRVVARARIAQLVDEGSFQERDAELIAADPLGFVADGQAYVDKVRENREKTGENDAAIAGSAAVDELPIELLVLDLRFIGGSMGSVVGEKIVRAAHRAHTLRAPLVTVNASGGARQQEGIFSLMQMAKTVTALARLGEAGVPHISILTDPTLAGVTASYAGVGDVIVAEQGAMVGFAGPRVIEQTTKQKLPADAQRAEFLLEHGLADMVLARKELRPTLGKLLRLYQGVRKPLMGTPHRNGQVQHVL